MKRLPITAVALANGLGRDTAAVWASLKQGRTGLAPLDPSLGLPFRSWFAAVPGPLPPLPREVACHDTRQARLAAHVLDLIRPRVDAAIARWGPARVGVLIGTTTGGIGDTETRYPDFAAQGRFTSGYDLARQHNLHATADVLARLLGTTGPTFVQSSACSSSAKVLASAQRLIASDTVDAMLVGGIDSRCRFTLLGFHGLGILSEQPCRPLSAARDGISLGEAAALLLVEREGTPLSWLRAVGETSDAHHLTQPHPEGAGLRTAIELALGQGGVDAHDVGLVNAHATGTRLNDAAECTALTAVFGRGPVVVGTKGYTGHTLGAAGATEAALACLALQHGWTPGTRTEAPLLAEGEGLDLAVEHRPLDTRFALSTSAAFAGHNAAVLLEAP